MKAKGEMTLGPWSEVMTGPDINEVAAVRYFFLTRRRNERDLQKERSLHHQRENGVRNIKEDDMILRRLHPRRRHLHPRSRLHPPHHLRQMNMKMEMLQKP